MVFVGNRHCVHCGSRAREPRALDGTPWKCPRGHGELRGFALGGAEIGECPKCAGLWIDEDTFQRVISERAREAVVPQGGAAAAGPKPVMVADQVRYIPCPDCGKVMNRTNYSRTSGIVLDACKGHGVWCDAEELRRVIEFVQAGGLIVAHRKAAEALEMERRRLELARAMSERRPTEVAWQLPRDARESRGADRLGGMVIGAGLEQPGREGPAHAQLRAIGEDRHPVAAEPRLQLADARQVDDARAVHLRERLRVEHRHEPVQRGADAMRRRADVQHGVVPLDADPVDVVHRHVARALVVADGEARDAARGRARG